MKLIHGDALEELRKLPDQSVHACITDPPYFIHGLGRDWNVSKLKPKSRSGVVGGLRPGMKFDPKQGLNLQAFMEEVSGEVMRVLNPGGFYIAFSQARLFHRLAIAVEDAGFEVRDTLVWRYEGQPKAASQGHRVRAMTHLPEAEQERIIDSMGGRKTPQLKPQIEPMVLAQKPKIGTFVDNWIEHEVGLLDVTQSLDGKFPGQIMEVPKPSARERGLGKNHPTVKPVRLIEHLIRLFTKEGQIVLDPFMGSGSHGIAALVSGRRYIGMEREPSYVAIAEGRIHEAHLKRLQAAYPKRRKFKEYMEFGYREAA